MFSSTAFRKGKAIEVSSPGEVGDWVIHSTVSTPAMTATTVWAASFCFEVRPAEVCFDTLA
ncbi:hypothetical protein D3C73_789400 [compost metagenome]